MFSLITIRSFAGPTVATVRNRKHDRVRLKPVLISILWASFALLSSSHALTAGAQDLASDAFAAAGAVSTLNLIRWTGCLPEAAGRAVEISFALYQDPVGGLALWSERQTVKVGTDGRYTVLLGANSVEGLPRALFQAGDARWIEARPLEAQFAAQLVAASGGDVVAEVANAAQLPRSLLAAVPYAIKSADADTLAGRAAKDYVTHEDLRATITGQLQTLSSAAASVPAASTATGAGTSGYLPV